MMKTEKMGSIRTKLVYIFFVIVLLIFAINGCIFYSINKMMQKIDAVYSSNIQLNRISETLDSVQGMLYQYLNTKSSDSLENYYEYEQEYREMMNGLNTDSVDDVFKLAEKNVYYLSESYLYKTNETIEAKRGRDVTRYKEKYEETEKIYTFLKSNLNSMNNQAFIRNSYEYFLLRQSLNYKIGISMVVFCMVLVLAVIWIILMTRSITNPLILLAGVANEIALGNMDVDFPYINTGDEISVVAKACNKMVISIRSYIKKTKENYERESKMIEKELVMKNDLKEAQLRYLQAQINPHFLFNSLNAGAQLAMMEGAESTSIFIQNMADFFRYNLQKIDKDTTLEQELNLIDNYIYILNVRFTGDIHYYKDMDQGLSDFLLPAMILQPIVENAINHGIREMEGNGVIHLSVYEEKDKVCIRITDNGKGIEEETIHKIRNGESIHGEEAGIGLDNVISRIKRYYDTEHVMEIFRRPEGGTEVVLYLPKGERNDDADTGMR